MLLLEHLVLREGSLQVKVDLRVARVRVLHEAVLQALVVTRMVGYRAARTRRLQPYLRALAGEAIPACGAHLAVPSCAL